MSNDKLLQDLAREALVEKEEEQARLPRIWDDLSAGELSPSQQAELAAMAETSEEARLAYEAFRPLDASFRDRVLGAIETQGLKEELPVRGETVRPDDATSSINQWLSKIFSFERWLLPAWPAGLAATAAVVFLLIRGPGVELSPLPGYDLELQGGVMALRSGEPTDTATPSVFVTGSRLELVLRPHTAVPDEVAVQCFLAGAGELEPWNAPAEVFPTGTVRIAGEIGRDLEIEPGQWTLWAVVGRPGQLPDAVTLTNHLAAPAGEEPAWIALRKVIRIEHNAD